MKFKPMLLSNDAYDITRLNYESMFISKKRDGIRAEVDNTGIKNRSLKILRNKNIQNFFKSYWESLPEGITIEAEIYSDTTPLRKMGGICNSLDHEVPLDTKLYIFGMYDPDATFEERMSIIKELEEQLPYNDKVIIVEQIKVNSSEEALKYYNEFIKEGFEGAVMMDGTKKYKQGRLTIKQHIGFKIKPERTDDLRIIDVNERMENLNESKTNELGHSYKRNTVSNKAPTGIAATFNCLMDNGEETKVTITGTEAERKAIWENKTDYIGRYAVVKSMDYGTKDKLRHPRLITIKDSIEK